MPPAPGVPGEIRGLLVEDSEQFAGHVGEVLRSAPGPHIEVERADRLSDALGRLGRTAYDFVLLDLGLPDSEGLDTLIAVRAAAPRTPIVVLSADDAERALQAVRAGAEDFVPKGQVDRLRLTAVIRQAIVRRESADSLRQAEARLAEVFAQMPSGVMLLDADDRLVLANPPAHEYLLCLRSDRPGAGDRVDHLGGVAVSAIAAPDSPDGATRLSGRGWSGTRTFDAASRVLGGNAADGRLVTMREVTDEVRLQRSLETQDAVAAVGVLAGDLAARVAVFLREVQDAACVLDATEGLPPAARRWTDAMRRHLVQAAVVADNVRRFAGTTAGPLVDAPGRMDLAQALFDLGDALHHLLPEHIEVALEMEPGEYVLDMGAADLRQIFASLAIDARDAMPEGGRLTLTLASLQVAPTGLRPVAGMTPGRWAVASVADTCSGRLLDIQAGTPDPEFPLRGGERRAGVGPAHAYQLVSRAGGFMEVKERTGPGSRVLVYLPLTRIGAADAPADTPAPPDGHLLVVAPPGPRRQRIVDLLTGLGYEVQVADDARGGLKAYAADQDRIDAVLCHADPPTPAGQDGIALAAALHEVDALVRVLLLTGRPPQAHGGAGHPAVYGWVQEPVEIVGLQAALAQAIGRPRGADP